MKLQRALFAALMLGLACPAVAQVTAPAPFATLLTATPQTLKATRGTLQWVSCYNPNASAAYVQLFDTKVATPGTTAPKLSFGLPATALTNAPAAAQFVNAITVAATTAFAGNSAPGSAVACSFGFN